MFETGPKLLFFCSTSPYTPLILRSRSWVLKIHVNAAKKSKHNIRQAFPSDDRSCLFCGIMSLKKGLESRTIPNKASLMVKLALQVPISTWQRQQFSIYHVNHL